MNDPLAGLARRAEGRPEFLAALLAAFARSDGLDDAALAAHLGCDPGKLPAVRLCLAPGEEPAQMRDDVRRIADHFGLREEALRKAVTRGRVLLLMRQNEGGLTLAARDREGER